MTTPDLTFPSCATDPESLEVRWLRLPGIERFEAEGGAVLTFDDGPDSDGTPAVLDALDAADVRATFFVLGTCLLRHPSIAHEALARGHELALHGFEHVDHDHVSPSEAKEQVERGLWTFETVLGFRPRWFRPPFGRMTEGSFAACKQHGLEPVYWSALGRDWEPVSGGQVAQTVCDGLAAGTVVLLHDSAQFAQRSSTAPTAHAVALVARYARARGIELGRLGDWVPPDRGREHSRP